MKTIKIFLALALVALGWSCSEDELDSKSIFDTSIPQRNELDTWVLENYTKPYNIDFKYKYEDNESDMDYNVTPAEYGSSVALAKLVKFLWVDAYEELAGPDFIRTYCPKVMCLVGSPEYEKSGGSMVLGTAEGGLKITLFNVNALDPKNPNINVLNEWYFKTMHHEFAHILHQKKNYPTDFNLLSAGKYQGAGWINIEADADAFKLGFVSRYASSEVQEDFVEILAVYVTYSTIAWNNILKTAGKTGSEIILQKLEMVTDYLSDSWDIDINELRRIVLERQGKIGTLDLENVN